jgi:acyl carrier protein
MNADPIYDQVVKAIAEGLMVDRSRITPTARLQEDLGATSLDYVTIAMDLEDSFGKQVFADEAREFATVADIVDFVRARLQAAGA